MKISWACGNHRPYCAFHCKSEVWIFESVLPTSNLKALVLPTWLSAAYRCCHKYPQQLIYPGWGHFKKDRMSRLLTHAVKDFYWVGKSNCLLCPPPYCCDGIFVYVSEFKLCRSCRSHRLGIPTWMAVPLHFSVSEVVFFSEFCVQWNTLLFQMCSWKPIKKPSDFKGTRTAKMLAYFCVLGLFLQHSIVSYVHFFILIRCAFWCITPTYWTEVSIRMVITSPSDRLLCVSFIPGPRVCQ